MPLIYFDDPLAVCFFCHHYLLEHDETTEDLECTICGCEQFIPC
jgi:hypothetical protein